MTDIAPMTTSSNPPLPPGAISASPWEPASGKYPAYRIVNTSERTLTDQDRKSVV